MAEGDFQTPFVGGDISCCCFQLARLDSVTSAKKVIRRRNGRFNLTNEENECQKIYYF